MRANHKPETNDKCQEKPEIVVVPLPHKRLLLAGSPALTDTVSPKPSFARGISWDEFDFLEE